MSGRRSFAGGAREDPALLQVGEGEYGEGDVFMGVRMGEVFALSKEFMEMPPAEIEKLLESPVHEVLAGELKIMAKQAASKKASTARRKELFELYLRRTDRINNWDLVDVSAPDVIGRYLIDRHETFSTSWRTQRTCGNAAPPS